MFTCCTIIGTKEPCYNVTYFPDLRNNSSSSSSLKNVSLLPPNNNTKEKFLENKLKYLAHVHHPTSMVGKMPQKPLDLANIQKMIDEAKYGMYPENDDVLDETGNDTTDSDKVKRSRLTRDYYSDYDDGGYDEKEFNSMDDTSDLARIFVVPDNDRRSRKRNRARQRNKSPKNIPEKQKNSPKEDKNDDVSPPLSDDFSEIQLKLTPEQEMDIQKFEADLNASPEPFHFDVDKFIQEKSLERPVTPSYIDEATTKKYFEFAKTLNKRDLHTKFEAYRNLVRGNKETYSPILAYNYNDDYAKTYRKQLLGNSKKDETKDENFIDKYYLLNDGHTEDVQESLPSSFSNTNQGQGSRTPNLLDLDIDLRLNKEFEDLEYEKEKVRQGEGDIKDAVDDGQQTHRSDQIYHFNAIR